MRFHDGLGNWWWVTSDCCGVFCAFFTCGLHVFAYINQFLHVIGPRFGYFSVPMVLYTFLTALAVISHCRCQFTPPGCVPRDLRPRNSAEDEDFAKLRSTDKGMYWCRRCDAIKPPGSHHCSTAGRCVYKMDHYCPWVNNVVGMYTQKYFLLFIFWTFTTCVFCGWSLVTRFLACTSHRGYSKTPDFCNTTPLDFALCVVNMIEGILFGLFTAIMTWDQLSAISENTPYIDRLKGRKGKQRTFYENMKEVFGESFTMTWFLPIAVTDELQDLYQEYTYSVYQLPVKIKESVEQAQQRAKLLQNKKDAIQRKNKNSKGKNGR